MTSASVMAASKANASKTLNKLMRNSELKLSIYKVYKYFKKRRSGKTFEHQQELICTVAEATGLAGDVVKMIIDEADFLKKQRRERIIFKIRGAAKKEQRYCTKKIKITPEIKDAIRKKFVVLYALTNRIPSVNALNKEVRRNNILKCSNSYLRNLLNKMGFTTPSREDTYLLWLKEEIDNRRRRYLEAIQDLRTQGKAIFFLSETKAWTEDEDTEIKGMPSYVAVAGNAKGFTDRTFIELNMKPAPKEQQEDQCFEFYKCHWMNDIVLPKIPPSSVIVLNTEIYGGLEDPENKEIPDNTCTKAIMQGWLKLHEVAYSKKDSKCTLYNTIVHNAPILYKISNLVKIHGHDVIYLPQHQLDLDPGAVMWSNIKSGLCMAHPAQLFMQYPRKDWIECIQSVTFAPITDNSDSDSDIPQHAAQNQSENSDTNAAMLQGTAQNANENVRNAESQTLYTLQTEIENGNTGTDDGAYMLPNFVQNDPENLEVDADMHQRIAENGDHPHKACLPQQVTLNENENLDGGAPMHVTEDITKAININLDILQPVEPNVSKILCIDGSNIVCIMTHATVNNPVIQQVAQNEYDQCIPQNAQAGVLQHTSLNGNENQNGGIQLLASENENQVYFVNFDMTQPHGRNRSEDHDGDAGIPEVVVQNENEYVDVDGDADIDQSKNLDVDMQDKCEEDV